MIVPVGATSVSVDVFFADDSGFALTGKAASDFPACKWSGGANTADTTITLSDLAAITTAHPNDNTAGGVKEREGGWYRLDLPNNMFTAAGRKTLTFAEATGKRIIAPPLDVQIVQADLQTVKTQTVTASAGVTFPASIGTSTLTQAQVTGGAYALATDASGVVKSNLSQILGTALTETSGYLAAAFKKFFNVSPPTGTVNSLPAAAPGTQDGLVINGANTGTMTIGTLGISGPVTLSSTLSITGLVTYGSLTVSGGTTLTGGMTANITGNLTGNVSGSVGSVTGAVGSVTGNVGGNVAGSTASVTGAVGSVTGNVGGNVTGSVGSVTGAVGSVTGNVGGNVTGSVGSVTGAVGSVAGLTSTRLGYLDNLSGGAVSTFAQVAGLMLGGPAFVVPPEIIIPSSGTISIEVLLYVYDDTGALADADATPTLALHNAGGTDLSARLGSVTRISTGKYKCLYTSTSTDTLFDSLVWEASYSLNSVATAIPQVSTTVDALADYFTSTDRSKLVSIYNVIPAHTPLVDSSGFVTFNNSTIALTSAYDPAKSAAQAGDAMTLTSGERTAIASVIWAALTSGLTTADSIGLLLKTLGVDFANMISGSGTPTPEFTEGSLTNAPTGSGASVDDIADRLLTNPGNKLLTDSSGYVTATNGSGATVDLETNATFVRTK